MPVVCWYVILSVFCGVWNIALISHPWHNFIDGLIKFHVKISVVIPKLISASKGASGLNMSSSVTPLTYNKLMHKYKLHDSSTSIHRFRRHQITTRKSNFKMKYWISVLNPCSVAFFNGASNARKYFIAFSERALLVMVVTVRSIYREAKLRLPSRGMLYYFGLHYLQ